MVATKNKKIKSTKSDNSMDSAIQTYKTVLKVIGAGGAGNNTINHLYRKNEANIETIAINTDAHDLLKRDAQRRILIGKEITAGLGAGGDPQIGEHAALESKEIIRAAIEGADMIFLTCGMGGGTGTGSMPVIAQIARELGILSVGVVTMPFSDEGVIRWENAQIGLEKLRKKVDSLIVLRNDKLVDLYEDLPLIEAFNTGDEILINALIGLSDLIMKNGVINLDFADISMVLRDGPNAVIGVGESNTENRVQEAYERAINHPMMESEINGAQSALVQIAGGPNLKLREAREVIRLISGNLDPSARIIWGVSVDKVMRQNLKVMIIASGLSEPGYIHRQVAATEHQQLPHPDSKKEQFNNFEFSKEMGNSIFDIKESILSSDSELPTHHVKTRPTNQTTQVFYKIFAEEATADLKRYDRSIHFLRQNLNNRKAILDAKQACKLLHASSQMFGFDEISELLASIEEIFVALQSREISLTLVILDSLSLAMEMVVDLMQNQSDGRGESGYIVDRLHEIKEEALHQ
ncbi:cell division protein FtsZ [bacterium]|nr:cell division protein FtsZ [bacterium]